MDAAAAGRPDGDPRDCRSDRQGNGAADAEKNARKPWLKEQWVLPKEGNADFVCAMEDVLEVYTRPYDIRRPVVCLDEASKQ